MISDRQRLSLKKLLVSQEWGAMEQLVEELCNEIRNRPKIGDSEWETLKKMLSYDGEERGIRGFVQRIMDEASQLK